MKLQQTREQINTMMQQLDPTWNAHQQLDFSNLCVRTTLSKMGQIMQPRQHKPLQLLFVCVFKY